MAVTTMPSQPAGQGEQREREPAMLAGAKETADDARILQEQSWREIEGIHGGSTLGGPLWLVD